MKHIEPDYQEHVKCYKNVKEYDLPGEIPVIPPLAEPLAFKYCSPSRPVQDIDPDTEKEKRIDRHYKKPIRQKKNCHREEKARIDNIENSRR